MCKEQNKEAQALYEQGRECWAKGERGRAISLWHRSAELDPGGPAPTALKMMNSIMDFFDPNQLNP